MTLLLHRGAEECDYARLHEVAIPDATPSHVPLPHNALVDMTKYALGYYGHEIVEEHHGITKDGMRYFGLLTLKSPYGDYTDAVGLRNSNDKKFPIGIAFGAQVFVCDNLSFHGDHVIRRKHTANSKRDLPGLVAEVVEPLGEYRKSQARTFDHYRATALTDRTADHVIMQMFRDDIINVQRIATVANQCDNPEHDWGDKTAWRMFNAATFALNGRVAGNPAVTERLHNVINGVCERIAA